MSVTKLQLTQDHINLVKSLSPYTGKDETSKIPAFRTESPLGISDDMKMDAYHIVYGRLPESYDVAPDVFTEEKGYEKYKFTEEENNYLDKLLSELHLALDIILWFAGEKVEPGLYKTKFPLRDWKRKK